MTDCEISRHISVSLCFALSLSPKFKMASRGAVWPNQPRGQGHSQACSRPRISSIFCSIGLIQDSAHWISAASLRALRWESALMLINFQSSGCEKVRDPGFEVSCVDEWRTWDSMIEIVWLLLNSLVWKGKKLRDPEFRRGLFTR